MLSGRPSARVVLVGTGEYTRVDRGMTQIPVVSATLTAMQTAMVDFFGLAGVPDPVENPADRQAVLGPLAEAVATARDLVLFYYVGHGLRDSSRNLYLGLQESEDDDDHGRRETALAADDVFAVLRKGRSPCQAVVILDCCFARSAFDAPRAADLHLLVATDRTRKARFEPSGLYPAFSGELLRVLRDGVPDGPELLDVATVFRHVDVALRANGLPVAHQRQVDDSGSVPLGRNPAWGTATTDAGLRARARFADRAGRIGRVEEAVRLFAGIVTDAAVSMPFGEAVFDYRHAHAVWVGAAGDRRRAAELLEALLSDSAGHVVSVGQVAPVGPDRVEQARANLELLSRTAAGRRHRR